MDLKFDNRAFRYAFSQYDRVTIEGTQFRPASFNETGWLMELQNGSGACMQFPHDRLSRLVSMGRVKTERDHFHPVKARLSHVSADTRISSLTATQKTRVAMQSAYVEAFFELEQKKLIKRTDAAIDANRERLEGLAAKYLRFKGQITGNHTGRTTEVPQCPSPRTLRKWLKSYEAEGLLGLTNNIHRRGNRASGLDPEVRTLIHREIQAYLSPEKPSMQAVFQAAHLALIKLNDARAEEKMPPLVMPSRETVRRAIRHLDPYLVTLRRSGAEAARKLFAPVGPGLNLTRPLERVEIDEWTIDLMSLFPGITDWVERLPDHERRLLAVEKRADRWMLTLAICATTRCIVGMVLTPSARSSAAIQVLKMILTDKGAWSDAVKTHDGWIQHGVPETLVTDCGVAFRAAEFQRCCADLGIAVQRTVAGVPELRGTVERMFRTISTNLLSHLTGRTFSDVVTKGGLDPADRASLTVDDLAFALVRWVVDVYHNTEHGGLGGETPAQCWRRLTEHYGVCPTPDTQTLRHVFGVPFYRMLGKRGLAVMGVHYHSTELAQWMLQSSDRKLEIRWLASDIGAIEVRIGERWITVPAVMDGLDGIRAPLWLRAVRQVRAADPERKKQNQEVVLRALQAIIDRTKASQLAAGIVVDEWSEERVRREENRLFIGFDIGETRTRLRTDGGLGRSISGPETEDTPALRVDPDKSAARNRRCGSTAKFKLEE